MRWVIFIFIMWTIFGVATKIPQISKKKLCKYPKIPQIIRGTFFKKILNPGDLLQSTNKKKKIERTFWGDT